MTPLERLLDSRTYGVERCDHVVGLDCNCGQSEEWRGVVSIGHYGVAVLEQAHRPAVFLPRERRVPVCCATAGRATSIEADVAIMIHLAWFHHRGEEQAASDAASINGRTADGSNLQQRVLAVEAVE